MSEKIQSEVISRRKALSLLWLAAALSLAVPPTVLVVSDAEAQAAAPFVEGENHGMCVPRCGCDRIGERQG